MHFSLLLALLLSCVVFTVLPASAQSIPISEAGHDAMGGIADSSGRNIILVPGVEPNLQDALNVTWGGYGSRSVAGANASYYHWYSNSQGEHFTAVHYSPLKQLWDVPFNSLNLNLWNCFQFLTDFIVLPDTRRGYDELLILVCGLTNFGNQSSVGVAALRGSTGNMEWNTTIAVNNYVAPIVASDSSTLLFLQDITGEVLYVNAATGAIQSSPSLPLPGHQQHDIKHATRENDQLDGELNVQNGPSQPSLFTVGSNVVSRFRENQFYLVINGYLTSYIFVVDAEADLANFDVLLKISWTVPVPPTPRLYGLATGASSVYAVNNVSVVQYSLDSGSVGFTFLVSRDAPACATWSGQGLPYLLQNDIMVLNTGNVTMGEQIVVMYEQGTYYDNVCWIMKQSSTDPTRAEVVGSLYGGEYYASFQGSDFNGNIIWNKGGEFNEVYSALTGSSANVGIAQFLMTPLIQFTQPSTQPPKTFYLTQNGLAIQWQTVTYNYSLIQEARTDGKTCLKTGISNYTRWCSDDMTEPATVAPFAACPTYPVIYPPAPYQRCSLYSGCYNATTCAQCSNTQNFQCFWCNGVCVSTNDYVYYGIGQCSQSQAYYQGKPACPSEQDDDAN